jgi:hypothetical protein
VLATAAGILGAVVLVVGLIPQRVNVELLNVLPLRLVIEVERGIQDVEGEAFRPPLVGVPAVAAAIHPTNVAVRSSMHGGQPTPLRSEAAASRVIGSGRSNTHSPILM